MHCFLQDNKGLKLPQRADYTTGAFVLVFGPSGKEGQFADMSEPAGRRCRLLSSAGAEVCKQEEQRCSGADRDAGRRICFQNTRRELISLVYPHGPDDLTGQYSVFLHWRTESIHCFNVHRLTPLIITFCHHLSADRHSHTATLFPISFTSS